MTHPIAAEDLGSILESAGSDLGLLRGERILLTGATGFFGKWITQALLAANDRLQLGLRLVIVTRDKKRATMESPWLENRTDLEWLEGDIRELPPAGGFDTVIHGAAAASRDLNESKPEIMFDTILEGTRRTLACARGAKRFLFISSGAVYGVQPASLSHVSEEYLGAPDPLHPAAAYGEAKRAAELLCSIAARQGGFSLKIARCYAFVGPYLPLDIHFAAGNFLRDVLAGGQLKIGGDGTPLRSYLYGADLVVWLIKILTHGRNGVAYNVGSDQAVSIADLAWATHKAGSALIPSRRDLADPVVIAKTPLPGKAREQYVPSTARAQSELGLRTLTSLDLALAKTISWHLQA